MTCNKHWEILKLKTMYSPLPGWTGQQVPGCKRNGSPYLCNMLCQNHRIVNDQKSYSLMQRYQSHYFLQCELCKKTKFKPYFIIFWQFLSTPIGPLFIYFFVVKQNFTWKISEGQEIDKFRKKKNPPAIGHVLSNNMPELKQGFHFPSFNFFPLLWNRRGLLCSPKPNEVHKVAGKSSKTKKWRRFARNI